MKVYVKPIDTRLKLNYQSYVDSRYKHSPQDNVEPCVSIFLESDVFPSRLRTSKNYFFPLALSRNSFREYHQIFYWNESHRGYIIIYQTTHDTPIRIVLPFKDQKSATGNTTAARWSQSKDWCRCPAVYISRKIKEQFKLRELKPPIVNQQDVVYYSECGLFDTDRASRVNTFKASTLRGA